MAIRLRDFLSVQAGHDDKLAGEYSYTVFLCVRNVSAFFIQLCWRTDARAASFVAHKNKKKKKKRAQVYKGTVVVLPHNALNFLS